MHTLSSNLKKEFYKHYSLVFVVFAFCMALVASFFVTRDMQPSSAASLSNFKAGNIISDAVMSNYNTMSVADIQNFLDSKNKCNNRDYNLYLQYKSAHPTINWHWEDGHFVCLAEERFGDGEVIGSGMTAAEIIYDAAQKSHINPQVLLVLLQKESSLITDKVPNDFDYRKATGYGCPDTAACDSKYYGFKNQIYRAAELFRYVLDHNSVYYPAGRTVYVGYHPSSSCGGTQVYIENRATAALYQYTPYQPNSAALNAGYGTGNACSAYGNRNFYLYFSDWFGSTQAAVDGELVTIPDGEYTIASSVANDRALGLSGSNAVLASVDMTNKSQRWQFTRDASTGYYQITNVSTGQPLITQTTEPGMGTNVLTNTSTTCSKNWKIYRTKDNYLTFESACVSGITLDVNGGYASIGTNIQTYISDSTPAQKWQIYAGRTIDDGVYQIVSALDSERVLDVNAGSDVNGTNITIWQQYQSKGHQSWQIQYQASGDYYTIINPYTGKSLDVSGGVAGNGVNVALWEQNNTCAQKWQLIARPDGSYSLQSLCAYGYVLDLNGPVADGSNVSLWQSHGGQNQQWHLRAIIPAVNPGVYTITSRLSNQASFDLINGVDQDGANIAIWQLHGGQNQQWRITYNPTDSTYQLLNLYSNRYLSLAGQTAQNGDNIQVQSNHDNCSTKWYIYPESDGYQRITSTCLPRTAVDLNGGFTNGNNISIWKSHGGLHQQWLFTAVE